MKKTVLIMLIVIICISVVGAECLSTQINNSVLQQKNSENMDIGGNTDNEIVPNDETVDNLESLQEFDLTFINNDILYQRQYFSTYYFYNLKDNKGMNYIGSCSYVAVAMMLSYYDTYWDDAIISDQYEQISDQFNVDLSLIQQSPGIVENQDLPYNEEDRLELSDGETLNYDQYYQLVINNARNFLHYKLIKMGREEEIYKLYAHFDVNPFGLGLAGRSELIENYLYDYMDFLESEITYEYVITDVEDYVIDKVSQGIPVLIAVGFPDGSGHAFIAYDYDASTGKIYGHMGWGDDATHVDLSSLNYSVLKNATTIVVNTEHSHAYNYISSNGESYCSCYFPCHPEHECTYEMYSENQHIYTCGHVANENNKSVHQLEYIDVFGNDTSHIVRCTQCNYSYTATHNYSCEYVDVNTHTGVCVDCGYEATLSHTYDKYKSVDAFYHKSACSCGATTGGNLGHIWTSSNIIGYAECKMCKYLKSSAGGNIAIIKEKPPVIEEVTE